MPGTPDLGRLRQVVYYKLKASLGNKEILFPKPKSCGQVSCPFGCVCLFHCD